jgi:uncharacterized protein YciI
LPLFVLTCIDKPDALERRLAARDAHLAYVRGSEVCKAAGPFLNEAGDPVGSLLIIEMADLAEAKAFAAADPYAEAGVFASVDVRPFKLTLGSL